MNPLEVICRQVIAKPENAFKVRLCSLQNPRYIDLVDSVLREVPKVEISVSIHLDIVEMLKVILNKPGV